MNYFTKLSRHIRALRCLALICLASLLFPILSAAVFATPEPETEPLPIWNGGAAEVWNGSGVESDPYRISTPEELALLAQEVRGGKSFTGEYFLLTADLYLNDTADFDSWEDHAPARRWIPIGGYATVAVDSETAFEILSFQADGLYLRTEEGYQPADTYQLGVVYYRLAAFSGILDGNGHTIHGLYSEGETEYAGLFGACKNAVVKNLRLASAYVSGENAVGGLTGALLASGNLTVDQCHVEGVIRGSEGVGGLIGSASSTENGKVTINASSFSGKISGSKSMGGIIGITQGDTGAIQITACENLGEINGKEQAGGILGTVIGGIDLVLSCFNRGPILCEARGGGIVGLLTPQSGITTISDCQNGGTLLGQNAQGGIAGEILSDGSCSVEILSCRNVGSIHGKESVGGIAGIGTVSHVESILQLSGSKNSAVVQGTRSVGGILGSACANGGSLVVGTCENYGNVTAEECAGGILGFGESTAEIHLYECSARASIIAAVENSGGIAGLLSAAGGNILLELSAAGGTVKAPIAAGGIVGNAVANEAVTDETITQENNTEDASANDAALSAAASEVDSFIEVQNCLSAVTLSAEESAGGIAGLLTAIEGKSRVASSLFCGQIVTGCKVTGGIAAIAHAQRESAVTEVVDCYFSETTSARAMRPYGGAGSESCLTTTALSEEALRGQANLPALNFAAIWQESAHYPTLQKVPFVWEEYAYTVTQSGAILLSYTGRSDIARIPDKLGGIAVTTISETAFSQSDVICVILPDSITAIGEAAFAECARLEEVTLSASLVSVGARAFSDCPSLRELRCTKSLSTLVVGSENDPFTALSLTHPVTLQISHNYEDGSTAGKSSTVDAYVGDYYQITPLEITGYEPDETMLSGICRGDSRISVIYRIGTYHLTIRYLFPDGKEALPSYEGDYLFGQPYSVATPALDGFSADRTLLEGSMGGEDLQLTVIFTEVFVDEEERSSSTAEIVFLILSGLVMVCCVGYFIHRYRVITDLHREEKTSSLYT